MTYDQAFKDSKPLSFYLSSVQSLVFKRTCAPSLGTPRAIETLNLVQKQRRYDFPK